MSSKEVQQSLRGLRKDLEDIEALPWRGWTLLFKLQAGPYDVEASVDDSIELKGLDDVAAFLRKQSAPQHTSLFRDDQIRIHMLSVHTLKHPFSNVRSVLFDSGSRDIFSYKWPKGMKATSSYGNLQGSFVCGRVLFETPPGGNGPYIFLFLAETIWGFSTMSKKMTENRAKAFGNTWPFPVSSVDKYGDTIKGICMYSEDDFDLQACIEAQYSDLKFQRLEQEVKGFQPFHFVAARMVYSVIFVHLEWSRKKAKEILEGVASVEQELQQGATDGISNLTVSLNDCSRKIRHWDLNRRREFDTAAVQWMNRLLEESDYHNRAHFLLERLNDS